MARTAPIPNAAVIPGMCPGTFVLGGGTAGSGGNAASARGAAGDHRAGAGTGGSSPAGNARGAPDYGRYPECGYASHPVDVATGRAFTVPVADLELPGRLPFSFRRMYSAAAAHRDVGLGHGWTHTLGWEVELDRHGIQVWNEQGVRSDFPLLDPGTEVIGPWGWLLRRAPDGFTLDTDDGLLRRFSPAGERNARFRLAAIEDRNRHRIALTYRDGALAEIQDSAGRRIHVPRSLEGRIAALHVLRPPAQPLVAATYTYSPAGDLLTAADADGHTARYAYDDRHRLLLDVDRAGLAFHFRYDAAHRCVESWGTYDPDPDRSLAKEIPDVLADGLTRARGVHHCRFTYDDGCTEVADSREVRRFFANRFGLLDKRVEGGAVVTAAYDDLGHLLARTDPLGAVSRWERDARGRVLRVTDPLGRVTEIERDAHGLPLRVGDPAGGEVRVERDARGNVLHVADPTGAVTSHERDPAGRCVAIVSPTGARTEITYDDQANPVSLRQPNGAVWRWVHDDLGRCIARIDPLGAETTYRWSPRGDLLAVVDPSGAETRYAYDGERRLIEKVDPLGRVTGHAWGGYGKLVARTEPDGTVTRLRYNREGELVAIESAAGEVHEFAPTPAGLPAEERTLDGRRLGVRHDLAARPVRHTDSAGRRTELRYDEAGQLIERVLPDGTAERFTYDPRGELVRAAWPGGELILERDAAGRVVRETQVVEGVAHTVRITRDKRGLCVRRATSRGHVEEIERDVLGMRIRTTRDGGVTVTHARDPLGREIAAMLPGGGRVARAYTATGLISHRAVSAAPREAPWWDEATVSVEGAPERVTLDTRYAYNAARELTDVWDRSLGWIQRDHDPCGRLIRSFSEATDRDERFRWDAAGNLLEEAAARRYGAGGRLERRGETRLRWDEEGRLIEKSAPRAEGGGESGADGAGDDRWWYEWDAAGRLAAVETPAGRRVEMGYDPFDRRLLVRVLGAAGRDRRRPVLEQTRFVWQGDTLVHAIRARVGEGGRPIVEERTYCFDDDGWTPRAHGDRVLGPEGGGAREWVYYVNDPAGAPDALVDEAGEVLAHFERAAWGRTRARPGSRAATPLRYAGQYEDEETGLCYNRHRYYDPELEMYLSPDPLGLGGGMRLYGFVPDPAGWIDPLGLAPTLLKGPWRHAGGHHVHGKATLSHHPGYSERQGFAISAQLMNQRGWDHGKMTAKQRACHKEMGDGKRPNTPAEHDKIAKEALMAGGVPEAEADELVAESRADLIAQGAYGPFRIPYT